MPPRVLQVVAGLIALTAFAAFILGVTNAPERGRLPGEHAAGVAGPLIQATEATPLSQERIEGPPQPPLTAEQKAKLEAEKAAKAEAEAAAKLAAATPAPPAVKPAIAAPATPVPDRVGDLLQSVSPPLEEAPY